MQKDSVPHMMQHSLKYSNSIHRLCSSRQVRFKFPSKGISKEKKGANRVWLVYNMGNTTYIQIRWWYKPGIKQFHHENTCTTNKEPVNRHIRQKAKQVSTHSSLINTKICQPMKTVRWSMRWCIFKYTLAHCLESKFRIVQNLIVFRYVCLS